MEGGVDVGLFGVPRTRRPLLGECREASVDHRDVRLSVTVMVIAKGFQRLLVVCMRRIGERLQLFGIPPRTTRVFRRSHPGSFQQAGIASLWISRGDTLDFDAVLSSIDDVGEVVEGLAASTEGRGVGNEGVRTGRYGGSRS